MQWYSEGKEVHLFKTSCCVVITLLMYVALPMQLVLIVFSIFVSMLAACFYERLQGVAAQTTTLLKNTLATATSEIF